MKRSTNTHSGQRVTRISHLRKGQLQKKSKPNPCVLMTGVITTILMTFIYLVTSSMHRTMMEEHAEYEKQRQEQRMKQQEEFQSSSNGYASGSGSYNGGGSSSSSSRDFQTNPPKFVTVVLPSVVNPKGRPKRLHAISKTWGPGSNAVFITHEDGEYDPNNKDTSLGWFETEKKKIPEQHHPHRKNEEDEEFSSIPNNNNGINDVDNSNVFPQVLKVPESVATIDQGVPRLQYVIETIYNTYNPEYAFFVNDHTFVIPQHMCAFLSEQEQSYQQQNNTNESSFHFYAGHALKPKGTNYAFNSGAAGYFLSRTTMKTLIDKQHDEEMEKDCKGERKWLQGNPGLVTANCLKVVMGVDPVDTRDDQGRHVFHAYGILRTVKGEFDSWYTKKHETLKEIWGEDTKAVKYDLRKGRECCAPNTISFHYVEFAETLALHAIFEKIIESGGAKNISDDKLKEFIIESWPSQKRDIGGYSHNLPPLTRKDVWTDFLHVVKMIAPKTSLPQC